VTRGSIARAFACSIAVLALTAQTPAPAPTAAAPQTAAPKLDKPLRHLEYAFTVDYQQLGEGHSSGIGGTGSGVASAAGVAGRTGTLYVDIMAVAKDGGMVVRTQEWLEAQPHGSQPFLCAVYSEGRVVCADNLPVSDAENELMAFLGVGFIDPSIVDDNGNWQRKFSNKDVAVVSNFSITGQADANPLTITEISKITTTTGGSNWNDQATLTYDRPLSVPVTLHDVATQNARGSQTLRTIMDFKLIKDSFAHAQPSS
jgi:hypothetical protein